MTRSCLLCGNPITDMPRGPETYEDYTPAKRTALIREKEAAKSNRHYCAEHRCRYQRCEDKSLDGRRVCQDHSQKCLYIDCINLVDIPTKYCTSHMCSNNGCHRGVIEDYPTCDIHTLKCSLNILNCNGYRLSQSTYCSQHNCTTNGCQLGRLFNLENTTPLPFCLDHYTRN